MKHRTTYAIHITTGKAYSKSKTARFTSLEKAVTAIGKAFKSRAKLYLHIMKSKGYEPSETVLFIKNFNH